MPSPHAISLFRTATDYETFPAGTTVFQQGDAPTTMFVVKSGEVDLFINGLLVATLGEGEIFGEMALIDKSPRSADAVCKTDCELVPITESRFTFLVQQTPFFAIQVMRIIADRLRAMNERAGA